MMKKRDLIAATVGALVATALAGGIAWAAIPEGGVIQGCYDSGGNLKVVSALPCPKGYTPLQWNQQGAKGDKGDQGDPGLKGDKGDQGERGIQGPKGDEGDPCLSSDPACVGPKGDTGPPGADGVSVTSAVEPAGGNCPAGGSKFTAVNGTTYACNGADGSGTSGPVLFAAAGGSDLPDLQSALLANLPQLKAAVTCVGSVLVLGVAGPDGNYTTTVALWEGATSRYQLTPSFGGGSGSLVNSPTPQSFSVILRKPNGISFELRGMGTAAAGDHCSLVYHVVVSQ